MKTGKIKIGIVGLGTVGRGVVRSLKEHRDLIRARCGADWEIARAADVNRKALKASGVSAKRCTTSYRDVLNDPEIRIVVELVGGTRVARTVVEGALKAGKHVVTANKALLATRWRSVLRLANRNRCALGFESSVMAGVPVLRGIRHGLAGNRIQGLLGILNGTSNFIVTRMTELREEFAAALADARRLGFAEANASLDVDGHDAAQKLSILGSIAFGKWLPPEKIHREGLGGIELDDLTEAAREFSYVLRPLAVLKRRGDAVEARVHPTFVPTHHPLAAVEHEFNAVLVQADTAGPVTFTGRGAGMGLAASGVVSDLIAVASALNGGGEEGLPVPPRPEPGQLKIVPMKDVECKFYLRFSVIDQPNVLSRISGALGRRNVSIASCHQRGRSEKGSVPVVLITHKAPEGALRNALRAIDNMRGIVRKKTVAIRIEE